MNRPNRMTTIEIGGSSRQYCELVDGEFSVVLSVEADAREWMLAAPGLVDGDRVRGAHHTGWLDVLASRELGMSNEPVFSMNDAAAAGVGEWVLRGSRTGRWLYLGLGTGVGAAMISHGDVFDVDISHSTDYGPNVCGGCGARGCLDAQVGGHVLSNPLSADDRERLLDALSSAVTRLSDRPDVVVLGGGMVRQRPNLVAGLTDRIPTVVLPTAAPPEFKSAAPWGLRYRLDRQSTA